MIKRRGVGRTMVRAALEGRSLGRGRVALGDGGGGAAVWGEAAEGDKARGVVGG